VVSTSGEKNPNEYFFERLDLTERFIYNYTDVLRVAIHDSLYDKDERACGLC